MQWRVFRSVTDGHRRAYRGLSRAAVAAAAWAGIAALVGDDPAKEGINGLPLGSAHYALVVAVACGLLAWAVSLAWSEVEPPKPRRWGRLGLRLAVLVVALNFLLLAQPQPPPPSVSCEDAQSIGHGFRHLLNCDSATFMAMAGDPRKVLTYGILQSRPLAFVLPFVIAQPLRVVTRLEKAGPYRPYPREFIAYLIVNTLALVGALVLFIKTLESGAGKPAGLELLLACVALCANDVTKLFFWTPHTQIFNLFVPCVALYLNLRLLQRGRALDVREAAGIGFVLGIGLLQYGSFAVAALSVSVIQLLFYRRLWTAVLTGLCALVPYACWVGFVYGLTGSFYNHEVATYRQFVWMADCAKPGLSACGPVAWKKMQTFALTALPVVATPALLVLAARGVRYLWPGSGILPATTPALRQAVVVTLAVSTLFLAAMGAYAPRLCWLLVPPLILLAAAEFRAFRLSRRNPRSWQLNVLAVAASVTYVVALASRHGPYN